MPSPNLPDAQAQRAMTEQREVMMGYLLQAKRQLNAAQITMEAEQERVDIVGNEKLHAVSVARAARDKAEAVAAALADLIVAQTMWNDTQRTDDTALGGSGCWGDGINDVRLEYRRYQVDADGNKLTGSQTAWTLAQIVQVGSLQDDTRTLMDADDFYLVNADPDGGNKVRKSLKDISTNLGGNFPEENLQGARGRVDRVAVGHRIAFVPVASSPNWQTEVRYVNYAYNTVDAKAPGHYLLFGDTMNTSLSFSKPAWSHGFEPMYTKLVTSINGSGEEDIVKQRCFATSVEATNRSIKQIGTETMAESIAAAAAGKGTQVRTGPKNLPGTSSCAWHIAVGIQPPAPPPPPKPVIGKRLMRGLSAPPVDDEYDQPRYRGAVDTAYDDDDDDETQTYRSCGASGDASSAPSSVAAADRIADGAPLLRKHANEGRIGTGTWVCDAVLNTNTTPIAKTSIPATATAVYVLTIPMGTVPSMESMIDAGIFLKERNALSKNVGTEIASRCSQQAVDAGMTTAGPVSKKAKVEIETCVGQGIFAPGSKNDPPKIATGRPLLTGMPIG